MGKEKYKARFGLSKTLVLASQTGPYIPYCPLYSVEVPKVPYFQDLVPKVPYF